MLTLSVYHGRMIKNARKVTKLQLEVRQQDEFILNGLVSAEPDYKLCLLLNKLFRISLKNSASLIVPGEHESASVFSRFSSVQNSRGITYTLISNKDGGKGHLLRTFRNVDYIFIVHDPENILKPEELTASLRELESVTAVFSINPLKIKDKNLVYLIH